MIRLLVSVRTIDEALRAAAAGADFIDLKEPRAGALGALPPAEIVRIVVALRNAFPRLPVSATTGDFDETQVQEALAAVETMAGCGVDYVKVGVPPGHAARRFLQRLAQSRRPVVPVLLCDSGLDLDLVDDACSGPFFALMADTRDKRLGSLFDRVTTEALAQMIRSARASGKLSGLAGALRATHASRLAVLAPDLAGFRGAVCRGERSGELDARKVKRLARTLRDAQAQQAEHELAASSQ